MDGLSRASGASVPFEVTEGRLKGHYRIRGMDAGVFGEIEQYLLTQVRTRDDLVADIAKVQDPVVQQALLKLLYADMKMEEETSRIPMDKILEYINTTQGIVHTIHLCLLPNHPNLTREDALEIMNQVGPEMMAKMRDQASGHDWRGNSTGSGDDTVSPEPKTASGENTSRGEGSTASSPKRTGGTLTRPTA